MSQDTYGGQRTTWVPGAELNLGGKHLYLLNHLVGLGNGHFKPSLKRSSSLFTEEAVSLTVKGDTRTISLHRRNPLAVCSHKSV